MDYRGGNLNMDRGRTEHCHKLPDKPIAIKAIRLSDSRLTVEIKGSLGNDEPQNTTAFRTKLIYRRLDVIIGLQR